MFFQITISIILCISSVTTAMYNQGAMPQMQNFEAELAEANKAIEEYVASLPPAEQAEFNRQVEDMSRMFENMSEEEFEKFLGEMFTEEQMMEPNPFETSEPTVQEVVEVTLSADDKKKVETAIKVLDDVINQSNLFMVIINSSPDLPNRINRWAAKGVLANWQAGLDWDKLKIELENFVQKLYKALEQDLTTKKYKYLFELIADEALYNNIIQLQSSLNALVPTINLPEFSIQKLSAQSKTAIKNILNKYTESFYLLTIPKNLDVLFEKYAPEAEKIRAAEEAATKKALEASKGIRTPAAAMQAGMEAEGGYDFGYNPYGGYEPYYGGGYEPYYGGEGYKPDYGGGYGDYGSGGGGGRGGRGGESAGETSRTGGEGKSKEEKEREEKKKREEKQFIPNYEIERAIADIKSGLEDIAAAMAVDETTGIPKSLAMLDEMLKKPEVDVILAGSTLPMVDKKLSVIDEAVKKISSKTLNATDLAHYQSEIKKAFAKNDKELKTLLDQIDNFELKTEDEKEAAKKAAPKTAPGEETTPTKIEVSDLPVATQWAYFGANTSLLPSGDENAKLQEQITAPVSLFDIKKKLVELRKNIDTFQKKKAPAEKKKNIEPVIESSSIDE